MFVNKFLLDVNELRSLIKSLEKDSHVDHVEINRLCVLWSKIDSNAWLSTGITYHEYKEFKVSIEEIIKR